jgi:HSP90 family molecular chaperone
LQFRLNLDEKQVFERLFGKALYGRSELALREPIQNAIDAQRARILHLLTQDTGWTSMDAAEREAMYLRRLENQRGTMQIGVRLWATQDGGRERWWLSVADSGIGMNRETIANYLLKVGRESHTLKLLPIDLFPGNMPSGAQLE